MKVIRINVDIRIDDAGEPVGSRHSPATQTDIEALGEMRFGGQHIVASALFGEFVRRDVNLRLGILSASDPARAALVQSGDAKETAELVIETIEAISGNAKQLIPIVIADTLKEMRGGGSPKQ